MVSLLWKSSFISHLLCTRPEYANATLSAWECKSTFLAIHWSSPLHPQIQGIATKQHNQGGAHLEAACRVHGPKAQSEAGPWHLFSPSYWQHVGHNAHPCVEAQAWTSSCFKIMFSRGGCRHWICRSASLVCRRDFASGSSYALWFSILSFVQDCLVHCLRPRRDAKNEKFAQNWRSSHWRPLPQSLRPPVALCGVSQEHPCHLPLHLRCKEFDKICSLDWHKRNQGWFKAG